MFRHTLLIMPVLKYPRFRQFAVIPFVPFSFAMVWSNPIDQIFADEYAEVPGVPVLCPYLRTRKINYSAKIKVSHMAKESP